MKKTLRCCIIMVALIAFGMATVAIAADFYVVKDASGKMMVVDKKPADAKSIVKGPFKTKEEADKAMKAGGPAGKPIKPPTEGC
ncbi:MAG: hypothetical protein ACLQPD_01860 [Desulfomonilaceae bacterium]